MVEITMLIMGKLEVLIFVSFISPIITVVKFTTNEWTLPKVQPGTPPIKFARVDQSLDISCETNDENASVELLISRTINAPFVPAKDHFKERLKQNGQIFTITNLQAGDHARYKCETSDGALKIELVKGMLLVKVPIEEKTFPKISINGEIAPKVLKLKQGGKVTMKCESKGSQNDEYLSWHQKDRQGNTVKIEESKIKRAKFQKFQKVTEYASFTIHDFTKENINGYECKRTTLAGTETVAINIVMEGYCYFHDNLYEVGKGFVQPTCTASCKCDSENSFFCVSLCPPHFVTCGPGEMEVEVPVERSSSPKCFCKRKKCVSITDHCFFEEKLYTKGERFISKSCSRCRCDGNNAISCVSLCPPSHIKCEKNEVKHFDYVIRSKSPKCVCKRPICLKTDNVCKMEPQSGRCYASFRRWHFNATSAKCEQFTYGGCDGNPNRFVYKRTCENSCAHDHKKVENVYSMGNALGDCKFEGDWYKKDEEFISKDCKKRCKCFENGLIGCTPVCPIVPPRICPKGTMAIQTSSPVKERPDCACTEQECVPTDEVCKMPSEPGSCYAHIRRWYYNPSLQKCTSFIYGGCEGNANNFVSEESCKNTCQEKSEPSGDGTKVFSIYGKIQFPPRDSALPTPSCASVKLIDSTTNDGTETSSTSFVVSNMDISRGIQYQLMATSNVLKSKKKYSLSAVVNVGWCKNLYTFDWVKEGDYITRKESEVTLSNDKEKYEKDIDVSSIP